MIALRTAILCLFLLVFHHIQAQTCNVAVSTTKVCLGNTVTFTVTGTGGTITNISLNYGDGNVNTNATAISVYSYATTGTFNPTVTVTFSGGATCNANAPAIVVFPLPIANYSILSGDTLCFKGNNLCIRNLSTPGASNAPLNQLIWQLSNGYFLNTAPVFNQTHCYANTLDVFGHLYTSVLEVRDTNNCISRLEKKDSVLLLPKVHPPQFSYTKNEYCDSTVVQFTNTSLMPFNQVKSFKWVFGDGSVDSVNWLQPLHKYTTAGLMIPKLFVTDINLCTDSFIDPNPFVVNTLSGNVTVLPSLTQCFRNNEFNISTPVSGAVLWEVFDASNNKVDSSGLHNWTATGFRAKTCGVFRVRMTKSLLNCQITSDTYLNVNGPKATIANDTARVPNANQCAVQDTVYFKTPVPYLSCHHNNPNMTRIWNFGDPFAPPCTTDTKNGINVGVNCNWSRDSMNVKHMYQPGKEGCYNASLYMEDQATGCWHSDTATLALQAPKAGYDSTFTPPRPRLRIITPKPCMYGLTEFDIDRTLPSCGYQKAWINYDSACGQNNWVELDSIIKPRQTQNIYSFTCDTTGWVTMGLIIQNGTCYDTAWYHHVFRLYPKNPLFDYTQNATCEPFSITLKDLDTVQYNISRSTWSLSLRNYQDTNDTYPYIAIKPYSAFFDSTLAPGDTIMPSIRINNLPEPGIYSIIHTLYDINGCGHFNPGMIAVGYHKYVKRTKEVVCVNDTVTLMDMVKYYDVNGANYLNTREYWKEPARAVAGKERIWWDIGDGLGFSRTGPNPVVSYSKPGNYTITMVTVDSTGCYDTIVNPNFIKVIAPKAAIGNLLSTYFCAPQILQFKDSSYVIDSSAQMSRPPFDYYNQWEWSFGDFKPNSLQKDPAHQYTSNGLFTVKLYVTTAIAGCRDTVSTVIDMKGPQPKFDIITDTMGCAPFTVRFDNTTQKKLLSWIWFFGDNNVNPTSDDSDVVYTYNSPGIYRVRLQGVDTIFNTTTQSLITCNAYFPDTFTNIPSRTVYVLPKATAVIQSLDSICVNQSVDFTVVADSLYKRFFWEFGDGDTLTRLRPDTVVTKKYNATGMYRIMMAPAGNTAQACIDTAYKSIYVGNVKADFDLDGANTPEFSFTNKSTGANRYLWNFDDPASGVNNISMNKDTKHMFSPAAKLDTFWVCLWAYSDDDCVDSICKPVVLGARVRIPNVFTPANNDGVNDAFDIDIEGWTEYKITIYNRWGNEVYNGDKDGFGNDGNNWNGRRFNTGEECPSGVYYFIFSYKLTTEPEAKTVHGTVTLIR